MPKKISLPSAKEFTSTGNDKDNRFGFFETRGLRGTQEDALAWHTFEPKTFASLTPQQIGHRLWTSYQTIDREVIDKGTTAGSTASTTVYDGKGNFITATLADAVSFAAVYDKNGAPLGVIRLNNVTHKPTDVSEMARIRAAGGFVFNNRVAGSLAVSRAIGDANYSGVCSEAHIDITSMSKIVADLNIDPSLVGSIQIITTCDGFTDGAGKDKQTKTHHEDYLFNALKKITSPGKMAQDELSKKIAEQAIKDGSKDNVSVAIQTVIPRETPAFLLGVYDGHGGDEASIHIAERIGDVFTEQCALTPEAYAAQELSIYSTFERRDEAYIRDNGKMERQLAAAAKPASPTEVRKSPIAPQPVVSSVPVVFDSLVALNTWVQKPENSFWQTVIGIDVSRFTLLNAYRDSIGKYAAQNIRAMLMIAAYAEPATRVSLLNKPELRAFLTDKDIKNLQKGVSVPPSGVDQLLMAEAVIVSRQIQNKTPYLTIDHEIIKRLKIDLSNSFEAYAYVVLVHRKEPEFREKINVDFLIKAAKINPAIYRAIKSSRSFDDMLQTKLQEAVEPKVKPVVSQPVEVRKEPAPPKNDEVSNMLKIFNLIGKASEGKNLEQPFWQKILELIPEPAPDHKNRILVSAYDDAAQKVQIYLKSLALQSNVWADHILKDPILNVFLSPDQKKEIQLFHEPVPSQVPTDPAPGPATVPVVVRGVTAEEPPKEVQRTSYKYLQLILVSPLDQLIKDIKSKWNHTGAEETFYKQFRDALREDIISKPGRVEEVINTCLQHLRGVQIIKYILEMPANDKLLTDKLLSNIREKLTQKEIIFNSSVTNAEDLAFINTMKSEVIPIIDQKQERRTLERAKLAGKELTPFQIFQINVDKISTNLITQFNKDVIQPEIDRLKSMTIRGGDKRRALEICLKENPEINHPLIQFINEIRKTNSIPKDYEGLSGDALKAKILTDFKEYFGTSKDKSVLTKVAKENRDFLRSDDHETKSISNMKRNLGTLISSMSKPESPSSESDADSHSADTPQPGF
jgi:integrin-linked kinase-associated serine/threonine phosphatase 2C